MIVDDVVSCGYLLANIDAPAQLAIETRVLVKLITGHYYPHSGR